MLGPALSGQFAALSSIGAGGGTFTGAVTFSAAVTFSSTAAFTGAITATGGIVGTTAGGNATAGNVGEVISGTAAIDSIGSWGTNTAKNVTSIALTAGDWDIWGQISWAGATTGTYLITCISTTTGTLQGDETTPGYTAQPFLSQANSRFAQKAGPYRASLAAPAIIYLVGQVGFTVGTPAVGGTSRARRVR